jgi:hypothetical protein
MRYRKVPGTDVPEDAVTTTCKGDGSTHDWPDWTVGSPYRYSKYVSNTAYIL